MPTSTSLAITIATRESRLALWQAEHVKALLEGLGHRVTLLGMTTLGDQILDRSLSKVGGKGLFVKELEVALEEGRADIAVHSLKDVPMQLPDGFALACVMEREDPRDAWVSPHCAGLAELPPNAVVGTSSLRRLVLLRESLDWLGRVDVRIEFLRGNLDTRLRKLDEGQYHAIVLAAAGLKRLGRGERIPHIFEPADSLPAAAKARWALKCGPTGKTSLTHSRRSLTPPAGNAWLPSARCRAPWAAAVPCRWPPTPIGRPTARCSSTPPGATRKASKGWCG